MAMRKPFFVIVSLVIFALTCSTSWAQDPAQIKQFIKGVSAMGDEVLCTDKTYLGCLKISTKTCKNQLTPITPQCSEALEPHVPDFSDEPALERFGLIYASCLIQKHIEVKGIDTTAARKCLESKSS